MGKRCTGQRLTAGARWRGGLLAFILGFMPVTGIASECKDNAVQLRGAWGEARFTVEVADDDQKRAQGLMHRESMAQSAGMLFIYDRPHPARFWMKNTLIPLDLIFMDQTGLVRKVHENAEPLSERLISGGRGIMYVLEVNGGVAARFGIGEGDVLRHPAIFQDEAAWPC